MAQRLSAVGAEWFFSQYPRVKENENISPGGGWEAEIPGTENETKTGTDSFS